MEQTPSEILAAAVAEFLKVKPETAMNLVKRSDLQITEYYGKGKGFLLEYSKDRVSEFEQETIDKIVKAVEGFSTEMFIPQKAYINAETSFEGNMIEFIRSFFESDDCLVHDNDGTRERRIYETVKFAKFIKHRHENIDTPEYKFVTRVEDYLENIVDEFIQSIRWCDNPSRVKKYECLEDIIFPVECIAENDLVTRFLRDHLKCISYDDLIEIKKAQCLNDSNDKGKHIDGIVKIASDGKFPVVLAIALSTRNGRIIIERLFKELFGDCFDVFHEFILDNVLMLFGSKDFSNCFFEACDTDAKKEFAEQVIKRGLEEFKHRAFPYTHLQLEIEKAMKNFDAHNEGKPFETFAKENNICENEPLVSMLDEHTRIWTAFNTEREGNVYNYYKQKLMEIAVKRVEEDFCKGWEKSADECYDACYDYHYRTTNKASNETDQEFLNRIGNMALSDTQEGITQLSSLEISKTQKLPLKDKLYQMYCGAQLSQHEFANNQLLMRILKEFDEEAYRNRHSRVNFSEYIKPGKDW